VIPNTEVKLKDAAIGALFSAVALGIAGDFFSYYVKYFSKNYLKHLKLSLHYVYTGAYCRPRASTTLVLSPANAESQDAARYAS
jgi:hypothetical protein